MASLPVKTCIKQEEADADVSSLGGCSAGSATGKDREEVSRCQAKMPNPPSANSGGGNALRRTASLPPVSHGLDTNTNGHTSSQRENQHTLDPKNSNGATHSHDGTASEPCERRGRTLRMEPRQRSASAPPVQIGETTDQNFISTMRAERPLHSSEWRPGLMNEIDQYRLVDPQRRLSLFVDMDEFIFLSGLDQDDGDEYKPPQPPIKFPRWSAFPSLIDEIKEEPVPDQPNDAEYIKRQRGRMDKLLEEMADRRKILMARRRGSLPAFQFQYAVGQALHRLGIDRDYASHEAIRNAKAQVFAQWREKEIWNVVWDTYPDQSQKWQHEHSFEEAEAAWKAKREARIRQRPRPSDVATWRRLYNASWSRTRPDKMFASDMESVLMTMLFAYSERARRRYQMHEIDDIRAGITRVRRNPLMSTVAYEITKLSWERRKIWNDSWGVLPGLCWKHEEPEQVSLNNDERYQYLVDTHDRIRETTLNYMGITLKKARQIMRCFGGAAREAAERRNQEAREVAMRQNQGISVLASIEVEETSYQSPYPPPSKRKRENGPPRCECSTKRARDAGS